MGFVVACIGIALVAGVLWDAFEMVVLPRRVNRRVRLTRLFYRTTWRGWSALAGRAASRSATFLSLYGPLSLLLLLTLWAAGLVVGFGLLQWGLGSNVVMASGERSLGTDLYVSGTTFFTLGLGDVVPTSTAARIVTVVEAGTGFGFLGLVITYLPVLYQTFSRREVQISLLDARAGSPPRAVELLRRIGADDDRDALHALLLEWERWSAELLESMLSYPPLAFFRSQHDNQSWLATLTLILDVTALMQVGVDGMPTGQARRTFAMARHAIVDICQYLTAPPVRPVPDRLPSADFATARAILAAHGIPLTAGENAARRLALLRRLYEPFVNGAARYLLVALPPWLPDPGAKDNWETTAWDDVL